MKLVAVSVILGTWAWGMSAAAEGSETAVPRAGERLSGRYEIIRVVGEGSASIVFAARDREEDRDVAIKWSRFEAEARPQAMRRMMGEFYAGARVVHPNIARVYRMDVDRRHPYLVMELLDGTTLESLIDRGRFEIPEAIELLSQAMDGVQACHEAGVIHRDIKPGNIFVLRNPEPGGPKVKVIDFGLARLLPRAGEVDVSVTQSGTTLGTPLYMAPEQLRDPNRADRRSDVYAFGAVLYEMLTQGHPFFADNYNDFVVQVATGIPKPITDYRRDIPPGLALSIGLAMARRPEQRFDDLLSFKAALAPFARPEPPPPVSDAAPPAAPAAAAPQPPVSEPTALWYSIAGAAILVLLVVVFLRRRPG